MKRRLRVVAERTGRFLRWWSGELVACAQDAVAFVAPKWRRALTVYLDASHLAIIDAHSTVRTPIVEINRRYPASQLPETLPDPVPTELERGRRVRVVLAAQYAFVQQLCLPLAALPHLKTAVSLQLPKLLPLDASHLLTDFEIASTDPTKGIINIDLASLKRADIEPITQAVQAWGFRVASLHIADGSDAVPRFRFASLGGTDNAFVVRRADRWLVGAMAVLGLGCAALAATQSHRAENALDRAERRTNSAASLALDRRQSLLARLEPLKALSQIEQGPSAIAVLADITALVPTDSWVTTFELKQHSLRLVGISPDSAGLVKHLSSSVLLTDVELRSSMSAGIGTGKDRFEISALVKSASP